MRSSGILMHITSLPGASGVGTMGKHAYAFVDFLKKAGQSYWQILPLTPTGYGDSPYQSFSAFAGNTHFIDLDLLIEDEMLNESDVADVDFDLCNGRVLAIIVPGPGKVLGFLCRESEYIIPYECITRIGPDIILVNVCIEKVLCKII